MEADRLLARLVVSSLTIFIVLIIALGVLLFRQIWLQQIIATTNETLQERIDTLEDTASELQSELAEIMVDADQEALIEKLDDVNELLDSVDEQIETIGSSVEDIDFALEQQSIETLLDVSNGDSPDAPLDSIDLVFNILVILISTSSLAIAVLLGAAIGVKQRTALR